MRNTVCLLLASACILIPNVAAFSQTETLPPCSAEQGAVNDAAVAVQLKNRGVTLQMLANGGASQATSTEVNFLKVDPSYENSDALRVVLQATTQLAGACSSALVFEREGEPRLKLSSQSAATVAELYKAGKSGAALEAFVQGVTHPNGEPFSLPTSMIARMEASFAIGNELLRSESKAAAATIQTSTAAQQSPCPISFGNVYVYDCPKCSYPVELMTEIHNAANKKITGTQYQVEFQDSVGETRRSPFNWVSDYIIAPGQDKKQSWSMAGHEADSGGGVLLWVSKVKFEDGSIWQTSDRSCRVHSTENPNKKKNWFLRNSN